MAEPARGPHIPPGLAGHVAIGPVRLLGVPVTALARLNLDEHERRRTLGLGPVTDPALLDRLLNLPAGLPVADSAAWTQTADLPAGIVSRARDGCTVVRMLDIPLTVDAVVVRARRGRLMRAIQDASLFAGFTRRWASAAGPAGCAARLEAAVFGVGLLGPDGAVLVTAEPPVRPRPDGWAWLLREKTYRRWLSGTGAAG
ncbi:MAG: hypothetical protein ACRDPD_21730 [Streptosporangiaceae bacterium]